MDVSSFDEFGLSTAPLLEVIFSDPLVSSVAFLTDNSDRVPHECWKAHRDIGDIRNSRWFIIMWAGSVSAGYFPPKSVVPFEMVFINAHFIQRFLVFNSFAPSWEIPERYVCEFDHYRTQSILFGPWAYDEYFCSRPLATDRVSAGAVLAEQTHFKRLERQPLALAL